MKPGQFTLPAYQRFVFSLQAQYPSIRYAEVALKMRSADSGLLLASIFFGQDIHLEVVEDLDFREDQPVSKYSYEVWRGEGQLYWYDPQPHPGDPDLANTHPHHKNVPPDIKHNRIPAPGLSFSRPNLPFLICEIEETLLDTASSQIDRSEQAKALWLDAATVTASYQTSVENASGATCQSASTGVK